MTPKDVSFKAPKKILKMAAIRALQQIRANSEPHYAAAPSLIFHLSKFR